VGGTSFFSVHSSSTICILFEEEELNKVCPCRALRRLAGLIDFDFEGPHRPPEVSPGTQEETPLMKRVYRACACATFTTFEVVDPEFL
jgi:hypothetical protein